jgi:hypothetical protein
MSEAEVEAAKSMSVTLFTSRCTDEWYIPFVSFVFSCSKIIEFLLARHRVPYPVTFTKTRVSL